MKFKMKTTKLTAFLMAGSLSLAAFAPAPARAANDDVAKLLGGILTLYVIGKAVEQSQKAAPTVSRKPTVRPAAPKPQARARVSAFAIPNSCVLTARSNGNRQLVAFERCLSEKRASKAPLPHTCRTTVRTRHGHAKAYDISCLTGFGYRIRNT